MKSLIPFILIIASTASGTTRVIPQAPAAVPAGCAISLRALTDCIRDRSIFRSRKEAEKKEADAMVGVAGERINPILNVQGLKASDQDPSGDSVQTSLLFAYDFHGLRQARVTQARSDAVEKSLRADLEFFDFLRTSYLALHRIRQLSAQFDLQEQTRQAIEKAVRTYKKRPRLTPEQESSRAVLEMALADLEAKLALQQQESHALVHDIEIQIGENWEPRMANLPNEPKTWPALDESHQLADLSLPVRHTQALSKSYTNLGEVTKLERRPYWQVGPSAEWSQLGNERGIRVGATLQVPLDLLESHRTSTELAAKTKDKADTFQVADLREMRGEFEHGKETYASSVAALTKMEDRKKIRERLDRMQSLLGRGLISGATYAEVLRQVLSLMQSRDELESRALDSWCHLALAENRPEECFR